MNQYANDFTDTVRIYYDDLKKTKPMTRAKEKRLLKLSKKGNIKARNEILESNLKFVFDLAKKYTGRGVPISELISEGNMGLIYAIEKFDENKDVKFISYAVWWIKHSMIEAVKKKKLASTVEVETRDFYENIHNGTLNSEDEKLSYADVSFSDVMETKKSEVYDNQTTAINVMMENLSQRETYVINYYYGLNGMEKLNMIEIGEKMGITSERVRQIKKQGIKKLRSRAMMLDDSEELFI